MTINPVTFKLDLEIGTPCLVGKKENQTRFYAGRDSQGFAFFTKDQQTAINCPYGTGYHPSHYVHYVQFSPVLKMDEMLKLN